MYRDEKGIKAACVYCGIDILFCTCFMNMVVPKATIDIIAVKMHNANNI